MRNKFLGMCILLSAMIVSASLLYITIRNENFNKDNFGRYDFYVDAARHTVYTFDKFTSECSKRNTDTFDMIKWNDAKQ